MATLLQQNARPALFMHKICSILQTSRLSPFLHSNAKVISELGNAVSPAQQHHSQGQQQSATASLAPSSQAVMLPALCSCLYSFQDRSLVTVAFRHIKLQLLESKVFLCIGSSLHYFPAVAYADLRVNTAAFPSSANLSELNCGCCRSKTDGQH